MNYFLEYVKHIIIRGGVATNSKILGGADRSQLCGQ